MPTNTLTVVLNWAAFLFWSCAIGAVAIRAYGYTLQNLSIPLSVGVFGMVMGKYFFPGGIWDTGYLTTAWSYHLIPGLIWALLPPGIHRGLYWWIEHGSERWEKAKASAARQERSRKAPPPSPPPA